MQTKSNKTTKNFPKKKPEMKTSTLSRALVLGAASVPALTAVSCDKTPERKPNVIFILMDDAG